MGRPRPHTSHNLALSDGLSASTPSLGAEKSDLEGTKYLRQSADCASTALLQISPTVGTSLMAAWLYSLASGSWDIDPVPAKDSSPENILILMSTRPEIEMIHLVEGRSK